MINNQIRIISGKWRGRKLTVLDSEGLRPTTDRIRETLFNWLMLEIKNTSILDLFAGTGALSFEAISRYGSSATLIENNSRISKQIEKNIKTLDADSQMQVVNIDSLTFLKTNSSIQYDLVFLDPPFHKNLINPALSLLLKNNYVHKETLFYIESEVEFTSSVPMKTIKESQTKQIKYGLYKI